MNGADDDLETAFHRVSVALVVLFSAAFSVGLTIYFIWPGSGAARVVLDAGLLLLIASPVARMSMATIARVRRRDWHFVLMVVVIALELALVLRRAAGKG